MARPRTKLPQNGVQVIRDLASRGARETDIARALGISLPTWRRMREQNPEAHEAYEHARALERDTLVSALFDNAVNKGNVVAAIFLLKSRHGFRDQGPADGSSGGRVSINVNIPASLAPDQYRKLVEIHPERTALAAPAESPVDGEEDGA